MLRGWSGVVRGDVGDVFGGCGGVWGVWGDEGVEGGQIVNKSKEQKV